MRLWLDDERPAPPGWLPVRWPDEVVALLQTGAVAELSLDHDLGDDARGTGYDVVRWIEEAVATRGFVPPALAVHSANTAARARMEAGIAAIARLLRAREAAHDAS
ncbi:cyclic-phosphate processing receiver domain-containing protein [Nannocystis bainbridge]|uniref:cyclic-phosphate processing receiver domain-containing protein n=1 Tax=Nannocystis bainbridge TaxID=2995303 RepID=UPI00358DB13D